MNCLFCFGRAEASGLATVEEAFDCEGGSSKKMSESLSADFFDGGGARLAREVDTKDFASHGDGGFGGSGAIESSVAGVLAAVFAGLWENISMDRTIRTPTPVPPKIQNRFGSRSSSTCVTTAW
jgi:hypothetical protein